MARRPPDRFVSASRQRRRLPDRALTTLFVGVAGAVTAAWLVALALLTLWLIRAVF
jgi:hypothetical protein